MASCFPRLLFLCVPFTLAETVGDWCDAWDGAERVLDGAFEADPNDPRTVMRGSGSITLGNGLCKFKASPRLYISSTIGWENVDFSAHGKFVNEGTLKSYSGLTMVARSNHDQYKTDGCQAFGYYARIYWQTGELAFQKEYFHNTSGTVYSASKRTSYFTNGVPMNTWIGMRFTVTTVNNQEVELKLYLDEVGDGSWVERFAYTDTPGGWFSTSSTTVPDYCPQEDGDTVLGPRNVCFLRSDGSADTEVHWTNASILNTLATTAPSPSPTAVPSSSAPTPCSISRPYFMLM